VAERGPAEVVRQYLEAEARLEPTAGFTAGLLHTISSIADAGNAAAGAIVREPAVNIDSLRLGEHDERRAVVEVNAVVSHDLTTDHGRHKHNHRFHGPCELTHSELGWRITSLIADDVRLPEFAYTPVVDQRVGECGLTVVAYPTEKGTCVLARVTNDSDRPVIVSDLAISMPYFARLELRWGSVGVPAVVDAKGVWVGASAWRPMPLRKTLQATLVVGGTELNLRFEPPRSRPQSLRARARRVDVNALFIGLVVLAGALVALMGGGVASLGLGLAIWGAAAIGRAAMFELAGFRSSGSVALALLGTAAITGSAAVLWGGFGWIASVFVVAAMLVAMRRGFRMSRHVRQQRLRQVETG
jgi:hypothetical protein